MAAVVSSSPTRPCSAAWCRSPISRVLPRDPAAMAEPELLGGRYEVLRTISEGPRASVMQALDRVHDRLVALKVLPVSDDDPEPLLAEARLLMSIAPHPGLPAIQGDFFTDARDRSDLVMSWA